MNPLNHIPHEAPEDWDLAPWSDNPAKHSYGWGLVPADWHARPEQPEQKDTAA